MEKPFPAYGGDEPYVFVCYAHDDDGVVYPELTWLKEQGVNVWYDEGISPGNEWSEELGQAIDGAHRFLYFITPKSVASRNCRNELHFAENHGKPVLAVYLEATQLPAGLELAIGSSQAIVKADLADEAYRTKLLDAIHRGSASVGRTSNAASSPPTSVARRVGFGSGLLALVLIAAAFLYVYRLSDEPVAPPTAIAVMPFDDLSPQGDQAWLANGLGDQLIEALSRVEAFRVPGRRSAEIAKQQQMDRGTIGVRLGVGSLVEGSVMLLGNDLRIVVRLLRITDGYQLWSARYDRTLDDLFEVQTEIAISIAEALQTELGVDPNPLALRDARYGTDDVRAYELWRKAVSLMSRTSLTELLSETRVRDEVRSYLERALEIDSNYASAHALLAHIHRIVGEVAASRISALRALELDPDDPAALEALGLLAYFEYDWESALAYFEQAVDVAPWSASAQNGLASTLSATYRFDEALEVARYAADIDPLNSVVQASAATILYQNGRYEEAAETSRLAIDLGENIAVLWLSWSLAALGRDDEASETLLSNTAPAAVATVSAALNDGGFIAGNRAWLDHHQGISCEGVPDLGMIKVFLYAQLAETEAMFECFEAMPPLKLGMNRGRWLSLPPFRPYMNEPRFRAILREVNLEAYAQDAGLVD